MKEGLEFWRTLRMIQDPLADKMAERVLYVYTTFKEWWRDNIEWPHYPYGRTKAEKLKGGASPAFAGVCYWALTEIEEVLISLGSSDPELDYMLQYYEKWCFEQFFWSDLEGRRGWVMPYITFPDGTNTGPSSMGKYGWLAATNYVPVTQADREKLEGILDLAPGIQSSFKN